MQTDRQSPRLLLIVKQQSSDSEEEVQRAPYFLLCRRAMMVVVRIKTDIKFASPAGRNRTLLPWMCRPVHSTASVSCPLCVSYLLAQRLTVRSTPVEHCRCRREQTGSSTPCVTVLRPRCKSTEIHGKVRRCGAVLCTWILYNDAFFGLVQVERSQLFLACFVHGGVSRPIGRFWWGAVIVLCAAVKCMYSVYFSYFSFCFCGNRSLRGATV